MPLFIGLMSGTSLDGIDAALVDIVDSRPARLLATRAVAMPEALRRQLLYLCHARQVDLAELAAAEEAFCRLQAQAVNDLLESQQLTAEHISALGSHGQTIEHAPFGHTPGSSPYTWQLDNPSLLAELTRIRVVADFRRRDLAAGGQAAPLAPAFHDALFRSDDDWQLVLNLGGFANLTLLPPRASDARVIGFDTGPANVLLDAWYQRHQEGRFDRDGQWAASGKVLPALLERLLDEAFFHRPPPKSTGREVFHLNWLDARLEGQERPRDVQATLAELSAASIAGGIELAQETAQAPGVSRLYPCGGGAHNRDLVTRLKRYLPDTEIISPDTLGWPADWLEAGAFAWLAARRLDHLPGNLPEVTGAKGPRVLGGVYAP
ncbi:anhydro-N-acetylmuramic acid kinase [Pistricoccus aurantiacus]|uniref:Anhydro-N-acetylmuramic acid kinase n=1 Tax=Pistricoccus aurantiacus TaxID=1883414 RepID=A0A5B8SV85_9GAMM|nr:anhydro-N-acetylmuramic acid kinase [Pistricoccus aurantiacus]QEA38588.1 anhydro-N-acetylmuramic acid kinase [Pistricoccus aurantiacus]